MTREERADLCRRIAAKGGQATVERHGTEHMSKIGKEGFNKTLTTHGFSDGGALASWLMGRGKMAKGTRATGRKERRPEPVLTGRIVIAGAD